MLVEWVKHYLNKGLKIMTNERDSVHVAMEAILLLLYAWNSAPIPGTDLSHSFASISNLLPHRQQLHPTPAILLHVSPPLET